MGRSLKFGYITSYSLAAIKHGISTHYSNPGQSGCFLRSIIGYGCAGKQFFFFFTRKRKVTNTYFLPPMILVVMTKLEHLHGRTRSKTNRLCHK